LLLLKERNGYDGDMTTIVEFREAIDPEQELLQNDQWHDSRPTSGIVG
jgi:hypothetical protein